MRARHIGASAVVALSLASPLSACTKNKLGTNVSVAGDEQPGAGPLAPTESENEMVQVERGTIERTSLSGSIAGLGDMLDAGSKLFNMWTPPEPGAPILNLRTEVSSMLVGFGFGPGFFESLALDGVHAAEAGIPHEGQPGVTDKDLRFAAVFSASNGTRTLEGLPGTLQPQPMGDNLWQLVSEGVTVFFRPQSDALEIAAMDVTGLDLANGMRGQVATGPDEPRIKVRVTNLPPVNIDIAELMPLPEQLAKPLSEIVNELSAAELAADFGTARPLMASVGAEAPFGRLGLDPIGPPMTGASELASALPGDALGVWQMPWGDPRMLHTLLDNNIPVDQIPAPFDKYVSDMLGGAHALLDVFDREVLTTAYIDKGKFTLVLAAGVKDEAKARAALREIMDQLNKALVERASFYENSPDFKYSVSYKRDAIKVGAAKGDLFKLSAPKDMHDDFEELGWFVDAKKPRLEISSIVTEGKLVVAIGVGQKATMAKIARTIGGNSKNTLEAGGGLALARAVTKGCQYCMALDPVELGELVLTHISMSPGEAKQVQAAGKKAVSKLLALGLGGELALGLRLEAEQGMLGVAVPLELLFAEPDKIKAVVEISESLDAAEEAAWQAQSSPKKDERKTEAKPR